MYVKVQENLDQLEVGLSYRNWMKAQKKWVVTTLSKGELSSRVFVESLLYNGLLGPVNGFLKASGCSSDKGATVFMIDRRSSGDKTT